MQRSVSPLCLRFIHIQMNICQEICSKSRTHVLNTASISLLASFRHPAFSTLTTVDHSEAVNNSSPDWAHGLQALGKSAFPNQTFLIIRSLLVKICFNCNSDVVWFVPEDTHTCAWTHARLRWMHTPYICTRTYRQTNSPTCPHLHLIQINRGNTGSQSDALSFTSGYLILHFQNKQFAQQLQWTSLRSRNVDLGLAAARKQETWWQPLCTV